MTTTSGHPVTIVRKATLGKYIYLSYHFADGRAILFRPCGSPIQWWAYNVRRKTVSAVGLRLYFQYLAPSAWSGDINVALTADPKRDFQKDSFPCLYRRRNLRFWMGTVRHNWSFFINIYNNSRRRRQLHSSEQSRDKSRRMQGIIFNTLLTSSSYR